MPLATRKLETNNSGFALIARSESPLTEVADEILESLPVPKPKRQPRKRKVTVAISEEQTEAEAATEKLKRQRRNRKTVEEVVDEAEDDDGSDFEPAAKKPRRRKRKLVTIAADVVEDEVGGEKPKKKRTRKIPEEDKVFDIPPIDNFLSTTFKGRLGYACLNTMLRKYSPPVFCSRTCRLATIAELGAEHVRSLGSQNIRDLHTLVKWNAENGIFFMRMSSEMFPFASHPEHGYSLAFADEDLKSVGRTARELGVRLTSHPGQFTQLGSPRDVVVRNAVRDLEYHCEMMDRMGLDQDGVMIIHMGGTFNDKAATLQRFKDNYTNLHSESIKRRLVLENDELCYNVDDLLPLCRELRIPLVFDYHHDWIYPSSRPPRELIPEINQLWYDKGIKPKQHLSEPRPGAVSVMEKRAHSDRVKALPAGLPDDMDLMLECKDKEQAVFYLYRLYNLREVNPRVLRPPAEVESLHTNGRKSNKRAKAKEEKAKAATASLEDAEDDNMPEAKDGKKGESRMKLEREAEEHGIPVDDSPSLASGCETSAVVVAGRQGLGCGSGDEQPEVQMSTDSYRRGKQRKTRASRKKTVVDGGALVPKMGGQQKAKIT